MQQAFVSSAGSHIAPEYLLSRAMLCPMGVNRVGDRVEYNDQGPEFLDNACHGLSWVPGVSRLDNLGDKPGYLGPTLPW